MRVDSRHPLATHTPTIPATWQSLIPLFRRLHTEGPSHTRAARADASTEDLCVRTARGTWHAQHSLRLRLGLMPTYYVISIKFHMNVLHANACMHSMHMFLHDHVHSTLLHYPANTHGVPQPSAAQGPPQAGGTATQQRKGLPTLQLGCISTLHQRRPLLPDRKADRRSCSETLNASTD